MIGWNRFGDEIYLVLARPNASSFKVPAWMTQPEAAVTGTQPGYSLFDLSAGTEHNGTSVGVFISNLFDQRAELTRFTNCRSTVCTSPYIVPAQPRTIGIKYGMKF